MLFNSTIFLIFFVAFFAVYWSAHRRPQQQNLLILLGSYVFYGWWDERFLTLIALSTACDFLAAVGASGQRLTTLHVRRSAVLLIAVMAAAFAPNLGDNLVFCASAFGVAAGLGGAIAMIDRLDGEVRRRAFLILSIVFNLGLLCTFKYFGFFAESLASIANALGWTVDAPTLKFLLPIGISFYTFQTLSYTIDVYRGAMAPSHRIINFAAYVAFFPQLVAGPIERARTLLPQFDQARTLTEQRLQSGAMLFLWGLYKKTVIADNVGKFADAAFHSPAEVSPEFALLGVLAFTVQIYCDFSGYSDMARGLAHMLGFDLMVNFNLPYFSRTPSEFWRRWHISLSSWLRDYLYVPLGGNRGSSLATYRNLFLTMLLGGLWHGAAWTFIVWGAFHGLLLIGYRLLNIDHALNNRRAQSAIGVATHAAAWFVMFAFTLVGWTIFRSASLGDAALMLSALGASFASLAFVTSMPQLPEWAAFVGYTFPLVVAQAASRFFGAHLSRLAAIAATPRPINRFARANAFLVLTCLVVFLPAEGQQQFIYFDF